jgi:hypothetical protein
MNIFDPIEGHNFLIKAKKGSNNFVTYEDSKFDEKVTSIYDSEEEALKDIKGNGYSLSEFLKPEFFKSYEELQGMLKRFLSDDKKCKELCPEYFNESEAPKEETPKEETSKEEHKTKEVKETPKEEPKKSKAAPADDDLTELLNSLD